MQCPKESDKILLAARNYVNNPVLTKLLGLREIYPAIGDNIGSSVREFVVVRQFSLIEARVS